MRRLLASLSEGSADWVSDVGDDENARSLDRPHLRLHAVTTLHRRRARWPLRRGADTSAQVDGESQRPGWERIGSQHITYRADEALPRGSQANLGAMGKRLSPRRADREEAWFHVRWPPLSHCFRCCLWRHMLHRSHHLVNGLSALRDGRWLNQAAHYGKNSAVYGVHSTIPCGGPQVDSDHSCDPGACRD